MKVEIEHIYMGKDMVSAGLLILNYLQELALSEEPKEIEITSYELRCLEKAYSHYSTHDQKPDRKICGIPIIVTEELT